ncbi:MAG: WD40/YVTN/BNR-like repeat-containing protein, partial [Fimbriimonadales bacterium]
MKRSLALALVAAPVLLLAQATDPQAGPWQGYLANLKARNVGPTNMGGRCVDLAVYNKEPRIFYVATASGGLWKTLNGGTTLNPVFEKEGTVSLGACAVSQKDPNLVWVGTGEATSRNSVAWGDGVYKSMDGGTTWTNMGLKETMHISRVLIDPNDNNVVYVGALGRTWGYNKERGVYKTTDGGKTWKQVFALDEKTGVADMTMNPKNPNEILVAMWQHIRKGYDFTSGGPNGGIYRTTDGGKTWHKAMKGIPNAWPKLETLNDSSMRRLATYLDIPSDGNSKASELLPKVKDKLVNVPYPVGRIG